MTSPATPDEVRRLMIIKQLYTSGMELSRKSTPLNSLSVLSFHDSVELMLQLVAEKANATMKPRAEFMEYWTALAQVGVTIPYKKAMERLNGARVNLKHKGLLPNEVDVEGLRASSTSFLNDVCAAEFSMQMAQVSRTALVSSETVRVHLQTAEEALGRTDLKEAMEHAARAFKTTQVTNPNAMRSTRHLRFAKFSREQQDAFNEIYDVLSLLALGLSIVDYQFYDNHSPIAHCLVGGKIIVEWMQEPPANMEDVAKCIDWVTDFALKAFS